MSAHQRESEQCAPRGSAGESAGVQKLFAEVTRLIDEGKRLAHEGSFEEKERNEKERMEAEKTLKEARIQAGKDTKNIKKLAKASMSAKGWTQALLEGDDRFARGDESIDQRLAQETKGLFRSSEFREKREALEAEAGKKREREEEEEKARLLLQKQVKQAKKAKREQQQRRGLSFVEDDAE